MSDTHSRTSERLPWPCFPLLIFAVSRALILAFAGSAPLFGGNFGVVSGISFRFGHEHPLWAAFAHGDLTTLARLATDGYRNLADAACFPLVPWLAKGLGAFVGSMEGALIAWSLLACAAAFVGLYRLFDQLRGRETARWGVALLAAFPFSYHLSDGSVLATALALAAWGGVLALRGSWLWAGVVLALAVLAHPLGICAAVLAVSLPGLAKPVSRGLALLIPAVALVGWIAYLRSHLGVGTAALWGIWWPKAAPATAPWDVLLLVLGALAIAGVLLVARLAQLRLLAAAGGLALIFILYGRNPTAAHALALAWPMFLGLGDVLAEHPSLRAPLVAVLGAQQGLLLYGYTHFVRLT